MYKNESQHERNNICEVNIARMRKETKIFTKPFGATCDKRLEESRFLKL